MPDIKLRSQIRARVKVFFDQPLETPEVLLHEVAKHARVVEIVAKRKRPKQLALSRALASGLTEMLQGLTPTSPGQHKRLVQAACRYFADNQEEGDHDLASDTGLDDDAEVFMAVATTLGRADLVSQVAALLKDSSSSSA